MVEIQYDDAYVLVDAIKAISLRIKKKYKWKRIRIPIEMIWYFKSFYTLRSESDASIRKKPLCRLL